MSDDNTLAGFLSSTKPGSLNNLNYGKFTLKISKFSSSFRQLAAARDKVYSDDGKIKIEGPYQAICLYADKDVASEVPFLKESRFANHEGVDLIRVVARIPELHASLPRPIIAGESGTGCSDLRDLAILMHPVFYSAGGTVPEVGNIVEVDFINKNDMSYGIYLGINDGTKRPEEGNSNGTESNFEGKTPKTKDEIDAEEEEERQRQAAIDEYDANTASGYYDLVDD